MPTQRKFVAGHNIVSHTVSLNQIIACISVWSYVPEPIGTFIQITMLDVPLKVHPWTSSFQQKFPAVQSRLFHRPITTLSLLSGPKTKKFLNLQRYKGKSLSFSEGVCSMSRDQVGDTEGWSILDSWVTIYLISSVPTQFSHCTGLWKS